MVPLVRPLKQNVETWRPQASVFPGKAGAAGGPRCHLLRVARSPGSIRRSILEQVHVSLGDQERREGPPLGGERRLSDLGPPCPSRGMLVSCTVSPPSPDSRPGSFPHESRAFAALKHFSRSFSFQRLWIESLNQFTRAIMFVLWLHDFVRAGDPSSGLRVLRDAPRWFRTRGEARAVHVPCRLACC